MKKIISFALVACMLLSIVPMASATRDYTQGTQVVYTSSGTESYTITVPALLAPGGDGTVTLSGTWAENRIVTVTAEPTVTLKNSIKETDTKTLNVNFDGISEAGSNTGSQTFTESVSVDSITNALFGTWSGKFNYNVEISNVASETGCDTLYWDGNTEGLVFALDPEDAMGFGDGMFVHVSDNIITLNDLQNGISIHGKHPEGDLSLSANYDELREYYEHYGILGDMETIVFISKDNFVYETPYGNITFPKAGIYFVWAEGYVDSITIPGYTGFPHSEHCGH